MVIIVNIGLKGVGVMIWKMSDEFERVVCKYTIFKNMEDKESAQNEQSTENEQSVETVETEETRKM